MLYFMQKQETTDLKHSQQLSRRLSKAFSQTDLSLWLKQNIIEDAL